MTVVLVVDDNAMIRSTIRDFLVLNDPECQIVEAGDGKEGLTLALSKKPDLIILDAEMPEMDGYAVARYLRDAPDTKKIPLIAISSAKRNNPIASGLRDLSDAALYKPFSVSELVMTVTTLSKSGSTFSV
jgi:CheY-like chemotaxis protein